MGALILFTNFVSNIFRYDFLSITPARQSDSVPSILQASYPSTPTIGLTPSRGKKFIHSPKLPDQFWG